MADRYMMATKAIHTLGDISRDIPDLCIVRSEDETTYIGEWVTGFGYIEVRFPKETTRELTDEERARYDGAELELSGRPWGRIDLAEPSRCERCEAEIRPGEPVDTQPGTGGLVTHTTCPTGGE